MEHDDEAAGRGRRRGRGGRHRAAPRRAPPASALSVAIDSLGRPARRGSGATARRATAPASGPRRPNRPGPGARAGATRTPQRSGTRRACARARSRSTRPASGARAAAAAPARGARAAPPPRAAAARARGCTCSGGAARLQTGQISVRRASGQAAGVELAVAAAAQRRAPRAARARRGAAAADALEADHARLRRRRAVVAVGPRCVGPGVAQIAGARRPRPRSRRARAAARARRAPRRARARGSSAWPRRCGTDEEEAPPEERGLELDQHRGDDGVRRASGRSTRAPAREPRAARREPPRVRAAAGGETVEPADFRPWPTRTGRTMTTYVARAPGATYVGARTARRFAPARARVRARGRAAERDGGARRRNRRAAERDGARADHEPVRGLVLVEGRGAAGRRRRRAAERRAALTSRGAAPPRPWRVLCTRRRLERHGDGSSARACSAGSASARRPSSSSRVRRSRRTSIRSCSSSSAPTRRTGRGTTSRATATRTRRSSTGSPTRASSSRTTGSRPRCGASRASSRATGRSTRSSASRRAALSRRCSPRTARRARARGAPRGARASRGAAPMWRLRGQAASPRARPTAGLLRALAPPSSRPCSSSGSRTSSTVRAAPARAYAAPVVIGTRALTRRRTRPVRQIGDAAAARRSAPFELIRGVKGVCDGAGELRCCGTDSRDASREEILMTPRSPDRNVHATSLQVRCTRLRLRACCRVRRLRHVRQYPTCIGRTPVRTAHMERIPARIWRGIGRFFLSGLLPGGTFQPQSDGR